MNCTFFKHSCHLHAYMHTQTYTHTDELKNTYMYWVKYILTHINPPNHLENICVCIHKYTYQYI